MDTGRIAQWCAYMVTSACRPRFKRKFTGFPYKEKAYTFINIYVGKLPQEYRQLQTYKKNYKQPLWLLSHHISV